MDVSVSPSTENESAAACSNPSPVPPSAKEIGGPPPAGVMSAASSAPAVKHQLSKAGGSGNPISLVSSPTAQAPSAFRSSLLLRFPVRIGITWQKGEKLEAQDFSNTWYPSKIVEINENDKAVLIHFEGWNQRYDEWFEMASERLRPSTRHSERKDKSVKRRRVNPHPVYRAGDEVLAKWKDCKKYPAKISRLVEEATYEVIFYDGITHLIQAINIQPLPEEMKIAKTKSLPPSPNSNLSFKQVKLNLPASIRRKQEQRQERSKHTLSGKVLSRSKRSPTKLIGKAKLLPKVTLKRDRELDVYSVSRNKGPPTPTKKVRQEQAPVTITCEATLSTLSEAECLKLFGTAPVAGSSSGGISGVTDSPAALDTISSGDTLGAQTGTVPSGRLHPAVSHSLPTIVTKENKGSKKPSAPRIRKRAYTDTSPSGSPLSKVKKTKPAAHYGLSEDSKPAKDSQLPALGSGERSKSLDLPGNLGSPLPLAPLVPHIFVPSKAFIVEEDHNPFKCPHEGCTKDFRKENLLRYHIKYYHTEPEVAPSPSAPAVAHPPTASSPAGVGAAPHATATAAGTTTDPAFTSSGVAGKPRSEAAGSPGLSLSSVSTPAAAAAVSHPVATPTPTLSAPKRRRRKTDSICSTDSEMSASSKSKSSKRHRNDSEISVTTGSPEFAGKEYQTDSSRLVQELAAEEEILAWPGTEEADEEEMALDVVNCTCGQRHHTGLMIQCEVCMCWQHFKCADVKKTGVPPANYVCLICEKPPGLRDSCKYLHDLGWERRGELPTFSFTQQPPAGAQVSQGSQDSQPTCSTAHLTTLASECNDLLATLQGIKRALHSTRRQIKISKEEEDPEFQLWQTDWDNWTKPEEDLTLTPRSAEPELSPTPSTFLFPPASFSCSHHQKDAVKTEDGEDKESATPSPSTAFVDPAAADSSDSPSASVSEPVGSQAPPPSLPPSSSTSSSTCRLPPDAGPMSVPVTSASPSQMFSVSSTPPKAPPSTASAAGTNITANVTQPEFVSGDSRLAGDASENQLPAAKSDGRAASTETPGLATDAPLAVNTTHSLTVNTTHSLTVNTSAPLPPPAPSPSSSLSSAHTSTPPMMLSPVPSAAPEIPQTPSVGRASSVLPSIKDQPGTDSLVKDLFPGPAGDAPVRDQQKLSEEKSSSDPWPSKLAAAPQPNQTQRDSEVTGQNPPPAGETETATEVSVRSGENQPQAETKSPEAPGQQKSLTDTEESKSAEDGPAIGNATSTAISSEENKTTATNVKASLPTSSASQTQAPEEDNKNHLPDSCPVGEMGTRGEGRLEEGSGGGGGVTSRGCHLSPPLINSPYHDQRLLDDDVKPEVGLGSPGHDSSQYPSVNGLADGSVATSAFFNDDDEDTQDNDTDTAEESADPYRNCEHNLLVHVKQVHSDVEKQLEVLEARMLELENSEHNNPTVQLSEENILNDVPALKKSLAKLARYLLKVQHLSS